MRIGRTAAAAALLTLAGGLGGCALLPLDFASPAAGSNTPPVGPISAPGCAGMEIFGYAQDNTVTPFRDVSAYYIGLRNNTATARIVELRVRRASGTWETVREEVLSPVVNAGAIRQLRIDLSTAPPLAVTVQRCI